MELSPETTIAIIGLLGSSVLNVRQYLVARSEQNSRLAEIEATREAAEQAAKSALTDSSVKADNAAWERVIELQEIQAGQLKNALERIYTLEGALKTERTSRADEVAELHNEIDELRKTIGKLRSELADREIQMTSLIDENRKLKEYVRQNGGFLD